MMGFTLQELVCHQMRSTRGLGSSCLEEGKIKMLAWNWNDLVHLNRQIVRNKPKNRIKKVNEKFPEVIFFLYNWVFTIMP